MAEKALRSCCQFKLCASLRLSALSAVNVSLAAREMELKIGLELARGNVLQREQS